MLAIVLALALPAPRLLWSSAAIQEIRIDGSSPRHLAWTREQTWRVLDIKTGKLGPVTTWRPPATPADKMTFLGRPVGVLWRSGRRLLVMKADGEPALLSASDPRLKRVPGVNDPGLASLLGSPDGGPFVITVRQEGMSRQWSRSVVYLPGLVRSPAKVPLVFAIDKRGVLGATEELSADQSSNFAKDLMLVDPRTGRVKWKRPGIPFGRWWGEYVLASRSYRSTTYTLLDGRTGEVLAKRIPQIEGAREPVISGSIAIFKVYLTTGEFRFRAYSLEKA